MVLITGFEGFHRYKKNPTERLAIEVSEDLGARGEILPVSFRRAREKIVKLLSDEQEAVVMTGLAPRSSVVRVEVVALNLMHSTTPDNDGYAPRMERIFEDGPDAYINRSNLPDLVDLLRSKGIPAGLSFHAGTYVCNTVYYSALHLAKCPAIFVHFPFDSETIAESSMEESSLPYDVMYSALRTAVEWITRSHRRT